jgi:hypothetical protein
VPDEKADAAGVGDEDGGFQLVGTGPVLRPLGSEIGGRPGTPEVTVQVGAGAGVQPQVPGPDRMLVEALSVGSPPSDLAAVAAEGGGDGEVAP